MTEKCRGCQKEISFAYREWWDENDDNACESLGTHIPFVRVKLAPTPVVPTMGPVAKWRNNGNGRIAPIGRDRKPKYNKR